MGKSQETFSKKEKEKKRIKKKQDKDQKKEERTANAVKGKTLEEMFAYVDENGNISTTPPDPNKKHVFKKEDMQISVSRTEPGEPVDVVRTGIVTFFNDSKGYGFIKDLESQESVFVHINGLVDRVKERDKVKFETERGHKGLNAVKVTVIN